MPNTDNHDGHDGCTCPQKATLDLLREAARLSHLARLTYDETTDDQVYAAALEAERATWRAYEALARDVGHY